MTIAVVVRRSPAAVIRSNADAAQGYTILAQAAASNAASDRAVVASDKAAVAADKIAVAADAATVAADKATVATDKATTVAAKDAAVGSATTAGTHATTATTQAGIATTQASIATTQAGTATTASAAAQGYRNEAQEFRDDAETAADSVAAAVLDAAAVAADRFAVAADKATVAADKATVASDKTATQGYLAQAGAIAFGSVVSAKFDLVIGSGAVAPTDGSDGSSVVLGTSAGDSTSQTYTRKLVAAGLFAGASFRGYASPVIGAYAGYRGVSDYAAIFGTHAGQDMNRSGETVPGYGVRATGTITFSGVPADGDTVTVNGLVFTARAAPSGTYEFAQGASAADAAKNLLAKLITATDLGVLLGYYRVDSATAAIVNVASTSRGTYGNAFTLAATGAISVSGATLTGGAEYTNPGTPNTQSGAVAMGFAAMQGTSIPGVRKATGHFDFSGNPADGDWLNLGFSQNKTVTFKNAPSGALDVQIGATVHDTLVNAVALLNGSADTTVDDVTYWAQNGRLFLEHDTNGTNTFRIRARSSVITPSNRALSGGIISPTISLGLGKQALQWTTSASSIGVGNAVLSYSTGLSNIVAGDGAANFLNGARNVVAGGSSCFNYVDGSDNVVIGDGIVGGAIQTYQAITAIAADGTITFAVPHGWRLGHNYACAYRDLTTSGFITRNGSNVSKSVGGLKVRVINALQVKIVDNYDLETGAGGTFANTGTIGNFEVARYTATIENAVAIGAGATPVSDTVVLGTARHLGGVSIPGYGLSVTLGDVVLPSVIPGTFASNGAILFATASGNFAADETVTIMGVAFTAKAAATFATPNTSMIRWFRIGADMWESLNNLLECIRNSDDQSANAKAVNRARYWLTATSGSGWRLNCQVLDTAGNSFTLATSKSGATVTAPSNGTTGNLPLSTSTVPPRDKGMVMLTTSPLRNGNPGPAIYDSANAIWRLA